jgi:bifunctional non-homologous end joining protein LigD
MAARAAKGGTPAEGGSAELGEYRRKRDFSKTPEPAGVAADAPRGALRFVVQKHAASRLHFDLRLELGGVMKSWAVPKGPSLDASAKRLAVQVEDHPMEYNAFEGTIPAGEYGGGTVMLWDRGHYTVEGARRGEDQEPAMRRGLRAGKVSVTFHGERLRGTFALVRTRGDDPAKPQWLFFKQDDESADPERDLVAEYDTSVDTGRTMDEIASGEGGRRVWTRDGEQNPRDEPADGPGADRPPAPPSAGGVAPMLATSAREPPDGPGWTFEPKWDGIRVIAYVTPAAAALVTRNGNEKTRQFPEVAAALQELAGSAGRPLVLDGEIVGTRDGEIVRFEALQGRMHTGNTAAIRRHARESPAAFVAFDLLVDGEDLLTGRPWTDRRARLETALDDAPPAVILGETAADPEPLLRRAREEGWEGVMAKRVDARYQPGRRSRDWLKLKLENRQELVVGGWTEPRNSRKHVGALLLGYYDLAGELHYAGHTGTGMTGETLERLHRTLKRLERKTSPFRETPSTNERPHWTTPRVVVEVRFNEWTSKGLLRQPVFVGVRDDKDARDVVREPPSLAGKKPGQPTTAAPARARRARSAEKPHSLDESLTPRFDRIEQRGASGRISLGDGRKLEIGNLDKLFFPEVGKTKGDLMRYYARMEAYVLPPMRDRPLVLKRFPDGESGKAFYQQNAGDSVPAGVRVETLIGDDGEEQRRFVGGDLQTLLYTVQLGAISYDPWHSRVGRLEFPDYTILDLDPGPDTTFPTVVEVALLVHDEMRKLGLHGALKTSGATGLHVYLPLPDRTPLEAATLVAQIVATRVAARNPRIATVERMTRNRPRGSVYVDYLQNILGKTVAGVYAVRATPHATVSTPLVWDELTPDLHPSDFTIDSVPERVTRTGDLWADSLNRVNSLEKLLPRRRT